MFSGEDHHFYYPASGSATIIVVDAMETALRRQRITWLAKNFWKVNHFRFFSCNLSSINFANSCRLVPSGTSSVRRRANLICFSVGDRRERAIAHIVFRRFSSVATRRGINGGKTWRSSSRFRCPFADHASPRRVANTLTLRWPRDAPPSRTLVITKSLSRNWNSISM